jgi:hypothetical protein
MRPVRVGAVGGLDAAGNAGDACFIQLGANLDLAE